MAPTESSSMTVSRQRVLWLPGHGRAGTVVRLRCDQDASTVPTLAEALGQVIAHDAADVVVDLSDIRSMGAETVAAISWARDVLRAQSRSLMLRSPSAAARHVLEPGGDEALVPASSGAPSDSGAAVGVDA